MRKIKTFITLIVLYEFAMLTILQVPDYCSAFFYDAFCYVGNFKYFLLCIMLPVLIALFVWWTPDIVRHLCPNKCMVKTDQENNVKDVLREIVSKTDIEKLITAAIIMGVQKFAQTHPKTTEVFDSILDVLKKSQVKKK